VGARPAHLQTPPGKEELIRTLGVSLVAIAAIVASLAVVRQRQEDAVRREPEPQPARSPAAVKLDLDQIRSAGL